MEFRPYTATLIIHVVAYNFVMGMSIFEKYLTEDGTLCFKCPPGNRLINDCSKNQTKANCKPCDQGTFQNNYSRSLECIQCAKECEEKAEIKTNCTPTSDLECVCGPGYYKIVLDEKRYTCMLHKLCSSGEGVQKPVFPLIAFCVCPDCDTSPESTFKNPADCVLIDVWPPNQTTMVIPTTVRSYVEFPSLKTQLIISVSILIFVALVLFIVVLLIQKYRRKKNANCQEAKIADCPSMSKIGKTIPNDLSSDSGIFIESNSEPNNSQIINKTRKNHRSAMFLSVYNATELDDPTLDCQEQSEMLQKTKGEN